MFTSLSKKTILITAASAVILFFSACHNGKNGDNGYNTPTTTPCSCEANWFPHATTPNTIDGKGGPFDIPLTGSTTNCMFHQWSWQKFLWLTRPMKNGHAFFQDSLIQVDADLIPVATYSNTPLVLSDTKQAGSKGDLITNPAYNGTAYKVYYSIYVNHQLKHAADSLKKAIDTTTSLLNNSLNFPNGSLELKVSWVNIAAIPAAEQGNYYQAQSTIMTVSKSGDTVYTATTVALLGMHVVGRVINHPEFIWATFEHHGMQPYYNWANATDTSDASATSDNDKLLFAKGTATNMSGITWDTTTKQAQTMYSVFTLYKYGTPRVAKDSFMQTCQPGAANYANVDSLNKCVAANLKLTPTDVWNNYFYNGSIWVNMDGKTEAQQDSLIVAQSFNIGNADTGDVVRGSLAVSNITMETYLQTFANQADKIFTYNVGSIANCFGCHTASAGITFNGKPVQVISPLFISHIFRNFMSSTTAPAPNSKSPALAATKGKLRKLTIDEAKQQGVRDFLENLKRKQQK